MMALINKVAPQERLLEVVLVTAQEAVRATVQVMGLVAQGVDLMADLAQEVDQIADLALDLGLALVMVQIMDHKMEQMEAKMVAPLDQRTVMGLRSKSNLRLVTKLASAPTSSQMCSQLFSLSSRPSFSREILRILMTSSPLFPKRKRKRPIGGSRTPVSECHTGSLS